MKYAVAYGNRRRYLVVRKHNTRTGAERELKGQGIKEGSRKDVRIIRILSHEEAKRKAAAVALLQAAEVIDENFTSAYDAAEFLRDQAEALWPALFHAGDGKLPRSKEGRRG